MRLPEWNLCVAQRANLEGIHPGYCYGGLMYAAASPTAGTPARGRSLLCRGARCCGSISALSLSLVAYLRGRKRGHLGISIRSGPCANKKPPQLRRQQLCVVAPITSFVICGKHCYKRLLTDVSSCQMWNQAKRNRNLQSRLQRASVPFQSAEAFWIVLMRCLPV